MVKGERLKPLLEEKRKVLSEKKEAERKN